jgi:hypothetical protein
VTGQEEAESWESGRGLMARIFHKGNPARPAPPHPTPDSLDLFPLLAGKRLKELVEEDRDHHLWKGGGESA